MNGLLVAYMASSRPIHSTYISRNVHKIVVFAHKPWLWRCASPRPLCRTPTTPFIHTIATRATCCLPHTRIARTRASLRLSPISRTITYRTPTYSTVKDKLTRSSNHARSRLELKSLWIVEERRVHWPPRNPLRPTPSCGQIVHSSF